jgi:hypothetical protein
MVGADSNFDEMIHHWEDDHEVLGMTFMPVFCSAKID